VLTIELKREAPNRFIQWLTIESLYHKYLGSSYTSWYDGGRKSAEEYMVNGEHHREPLEGPAYTVWHTNGVKYCEAYYMNGRLTSLKDYQC